MITTTALGAVDLAVALGRHLYYRMRPPRRRSRPPLRIGIDVSASQGRTPTGLGRYGILLLEALLETDTENDYTLLLGKEAPFSLTPGRARVRRLRFPVTAFQRLAGPPEIELATGPIDLFHNQLGFTPQFVFGPRVSTIHDVRPFLMPGGYAPEEIEPLRRHFLDLARTSTLIITGTQTAAAEIADTLGVPPDRIRVVPHAADPRFSAEIPPAARAEVRSRMDLHGPYILTLGTMFPHKNYARLVQAFAAISRGIPHTLVVAGSRGTCAGEVEALIESFGVSGRVRLLGYAPHEDLPALMAEADMFVHPSLYEGFGLPVLDAMAAGTPVACSSASALPEVVGKAAVTFDPLDVPAIAGAIVTALGSSERLAALSAAGKERAATFTWHQSARLTAAVYREAAQRYHEER